MEQVKNFMAYLKANVNPEIVISTVAASFVVGGLVYAANKSGIKPLKQVAAIAK